MSMLLIHTDGACLGNPGPGGWGCRIHTPQGVQEFSGHDPATTNNRMELMAAIEALSRAPVGHALHVHTDSQYVIKGLNEWLPGWKKRGWKTSGGGAVKNQDLWERLDAAQQGRTIKWQWVKGHNGHPENERVDRLASDAALSAVR